MKIISVIFRVLMLVGTLVIALGSIVIGLMLASRYGFFGVLNSTEQRLEGYKYLAIGNLLIFFSFSLLKKNNTKAFLIILTTLFVGIILVGGLRMDGSIIIGPYLFLMLLSYSLNYAINNYVKKKEIEKPIVTVNKTSKILYIIPTVLILVGWFYIAQGQWIMERFFSGRAQQKTIKEMDYKIFSPKYIPVGYKLRETRLGGMNSNYFYGEYRHKNQDYFMLAQFKKPNNLYLTPPQCAIYGSNKDSFELMDINGVSSGINSKCEEVTTPKGKHIYIMDYKITQKGLFAAAVIEDTLVTTTGYKFSNDELIKLYDSLSENSPMIIAPDMKSQMGF